MGEPDKVIRTIKRPLDVATRLAKFKNTYRMVSPMGAPKVHPKVISETTFMDEAEEEVENISDIIARINHIKEVGELEEYLTHEMKTVQVAANKRFKVLTAKK